MCAVNLPGFNHRLIGFKIYLKVWWAAKPPVLKWSAHTLEAVRIGGDNTDVGHGPPRYTWYFSPNARDGHHGGAFCPRKVW